MSEANPPEPSPLFGVDELVHIRCGRKLAEHPMPHAPAVDCPFPGLPERAIEFAAAPPMPGLRERAAALLAGHRLRTRSFVDVDCSCGQPMKRPALRAFYSPEDLAAWSEVVHAAHEAHLSAALAEQLTT